MSISTPLYVLKRQAKELAKQAHIPHHAALNRIAQNNGYERWSLLLDKAKQVDGGNQILHQLDPGQLLLLGARPGHGKTLMALELLTRAIRQGRSGWFFTLEYNLADVLDRLRMVDKNPETLNSNLHVDNSDDVSANYIINALELASEGSIVVVDYLQLLDQKRSNDDLQDQISALKHFALQRRIVFVLISQIDRGFDLCDDTWPTLKDVRLPNPLDLSLFDKACFVNHGAVRFV